MSGNQNLERLQNSIPPPKGGVGKETNFCPVSAAELLSGEPEPIPWVWEPFLPEGGLALLVAFMKVGKSTFVYALAVAVAQGQPFLGYPTKQGGVLILAVEEHPRDVKLRLRNFGMRPEDPIYVHTGRLDNSEATLNTLKDFIIDKGIKLVILDTLGRFWSLYDENNNAEVVRQVSPLLDLARETDAVVLLVHHERKSGGEQGRGIRGGSALFGLVDQALMLERPQGQKGSKRTLKALGRYADTPGEVILELVGNEYRKLGTPGELSEEAVRVKVLAALTDEAQTLESLAQKAGLSEKATKKALEALGNQVVREGKGVKGDPHTYRRASSDSIPSQPLPIGEETNCAPDLGGNRPVQSTNGELTVEGEHREAVCEPEGGQEPDGHA